MHVQWFEQTEADIAAGSEWLSASEIERLNAIRFARRRSDWRLGRWTAKRAVACYFGVDPGSATLSSIEVRPAPSGAPEVFLRGAPCPISISLSHRDGVAACAIGTPGAVIGCDLEIIEPRSPAFLTDYFTAHEQQSIARAPVWDRDRLLTLFWSAKESALKALHEGLRIDTRSVQVTIEAPAGGNAGWRGLHVQCISGPLFRGWSRQTNHLMRTMVANPAPGTPVTAS
jgi:4'-phosphopantetheinyl transferase